MGFIILLAFIAIPLIEIAVFIEVGGYIGLWWTLAIVVGTALGGTYMLRHQGLATLRRAQANMAEGRMPLREVFDGLCLLIAGALLLTPGFVTDLTGALLLMPPVRVFLGSLVARHIVESGQFRAHTGGNAFHNGPGGEGGQGFYTAANDPERQAGNNSGDDIIDVDFEEVVTVDPTIKGITADHSEHKGDGPDKPTKA
ncbi:MAG: FxsA family protein [Alphaproteobacteria bacterium]|nr:FxsA family protein [Alphaproteobacteria bacterium]